MVPPLANGNADLDKAYDMAVYADPAIRAKAQQAMQDAQKAQADAKLAAEKKAQKDKLEAARKASGSISNQRARRSCRCQAATRQAWQVSP